MTQRVTSHHRCGDSIERLSAAIFRAEHLVGEVTRCCSIGGIPNVPRDDVLVFPAVMIRDVHPIALNHVYGFDGSLYCL